MSIMRNTYLVILSFIFFFTPDHPVAPCENIYMIISRVFDRSFIKKVVKLWTGHSGIRIFFKYLQQSFNKPGCEFCIVIDNKKVIAFSCADAYIITTGKTEVLIVP